MILMLLKRKQTKNLPDTKRKEEERHTSIKKMAIKVNRALEKSRQKLRKGKSLEIRRKLNQIPTV